MFCPECGNKCEKNYEDTCFVRYTCHQCPIKWEYNGHNGTYAGFTIEEDGLISCTPRPIPREAK